ncbi:MAG: ATP-grasp domain-containing protein [Desulfobacterales bacterium]|nr:ATP-grasp domain-containing protein [Desulfobacterales bacterium]
MSRVYEYQGKEALEKSGVAIPAHGVGSTPEEVEKIAKKIGRPVVVKAQVFVTGRAEAGGIEFADTPEAAKQGAEKIFASKIKGLSVKKVLVEEKLNIEKEFYAAVVVDNSQKIKGPVLIFSTQGGTGIEEVAAKNPERVVRVPIDILNGLSLSQVSSTLDKMGVDDPHQKLSNAVCSLYKAFRDYDCRNIEMNPFVLTREGDVYAADCHMNLDDNSVFRHPEFGIIVPRDLDREPTELERLAWDYIEEGDYRGTGYITQLITDFKKDEIYVGFHGIGGGGSMLGAAALLRRGMKIANFADTSGDPPASKIYKVIKAIFAQPISAYVMTGAVLANQEQWYHAFAIVKALREELANKPGFPVVILLAGNKEVESHKIISDGLKDMDIRFELYGRDYIYKSNYIGERAEILIKEYLQSKTRH